MQDLNMTLRQYISDEMKKDPNADLVSIGLPADAWPDVWTRSRSGVNVKNRVGELDSITGDVIPVRSIMTERFFITASCRI